MIAILKYNAGNIKSVQNALHRLGYDSILTDDKEELAAAHKIIIPGVGEAGSAMKYLKDRGLDKIIPSMRQPVLGICLGLQLMCRYSDEGDTQCLGIFDAVIKRFPVSGKVPHMGWNNFTSLNGDLFRSINPEDNVFYVHSYYAEISESTTAVCDYSVPFSAAMQKDNFYATQFHPEKSAETGALILKNFLEL
ncbi:MAG: imidazole glycerol phosphate synthase subunit HisH [Bacteroidia bacterium]|jgi:glutamine amidotransferase|nr:MAG: imidazole glycerol phosphate synthase subunit HisH [Bacteroidia bacterium]